MDRKQIEKNINTFVTRVQKQYKPKQIVLFGSYAQNRATEYSDIDILIVADAFKDTDTYTRFRNLHKLTCDLDPDINAIGYTEEELQHKKSITLQDALTTGKVIFSA